MANTTKKSNGRKSNSNSKSKAKSSGAKSAATRKRNAEMAQRRKKVVTEVNLWISVAVALLLFLSNFGVCGIVGNALRSAMLGMFGSMGYVFPIALFVVVGLIAYNSANRKSVTKIVAVIMLFLDGCLFFHLFTYGDSTEKLSYFYKTGSQGTACGGITGGFFGEIFHSLIGLTGTYILAVVLLIISLVLLTEKSIMGVIKNQSQNAYENIKEESQIRREANALEKNRRKEEKRNERIKAKGVNFGDTKLEPETGKKGRRKDNKQEVHEIHEPQPKMSPEIHIEGIDDNQLPQMQQDPITYTYEETGGNKQIKIDGLDEKTQPVSSEHATDGEFKPKERIIVSEEAKAAMKRKPYGMSGGEVGSSETLPTDGVAENPKKAASEGKIISPAKKKLKYKKPPYSLLENNPGSSSGTTKAALMQTANKLKQVLANFGVNVEVTNVSKGPSVTRYELQPEMGTKVSRITGLADDIKLNMAAADIRIEAPIPGKAAVGIEIPNEGRDPVYLKELLMSKELREHKSKLAFPAGKDIAGRVVVADIAKMPHMLIAGTTGSGKSVFTNSILMSVLYRTTPEDVRLIVIDPKVVEFQVYNKIPHLLYDVVTDPKKAAGILNWAVAEMTTRYKKFANAGARDIASYNAKVDSGDYSGEEPLEKMPQILIVIDELADLMMVAAKEVEEAICRLAQLARAAGIHMVIATQRPSVDVITGLIKANIPSRVALTVASGTDSRTIIDMNGAEKLLGNGDMLFYPAGYVKPVRVQGAYVSDKEILDTVNFIKDNSGEAEYDDSIDAKLTTDQEAMSNDSDRDSIFAEAGRLCIEKQKGSTSMIQRQFKVGFNRAARVMEQLYDAGVVGQEEMNKPRKVIMSMEEFEQMLRE